MKNDPIDIAKKKYSGIKSELCRIFKIVGYCEGWEDSEKAMTEKACQWMKDNVNNFIPDYHDYIDEENMSRMLQQFNKSMSETKQ